MSNDPSQDPYAQPAGFSSDSPEDVYRSVSRAAIGSLVLAVLGLATFLLLPLALLSVAGIVFAIVAFSAFRKFPNEFQGRPLAQAGLVLCIGTLVLAPAYHTYVYMTEVPEGYTRLDFSLLKSKSKTPEAPPPPEALQFDKQQVFIKGYIHPTSMDSLMSKKFVLVPDLGTCCFGNQPPLTHMIEVTLSGEQYARKSYRKQRLAGTLRVNRQMKTVDGLTGVFYQLKADVLK